MDDVKKRYLEAANDIDEKVIEIIKKAAKEANFHREREIDVGSMFSGCNWSSEQKIFYLQISICLEVSAVSDAISKIVGLDKKTVVNAIAKAAMNDAEDHTQDHSNTLGSQWIDVTKTNDAYQIQVNTDGRIRWRRYAKPEDAEPPEWTPGNPPKD